MMKPIVIFLLIVGLILYLALRSDFSAEMPQPKNSVAASPKTIESKAKTEESQPAPAAMEKTAVPDTKKRSRKTKKQADIQAEEEEKSELAKMKEEMDDIEPDERSEDYYIPNDTARREKLLGGADVEWEAPQEPAGDVGKFGMPPQIH